MGSYRFINQFKKIGSFEGWFRKIMINYALQRYRDKVHLYPITSLGEEHIFLITGDDFFDRLGEKDLIGLIQTLPPAYRMVFNYWKQEPAGSFAYIYQQTPLKQDTLPEITTGEMSLSLRWAPNKQYFQDKISRRDIVNKYPILTVE